jgi:hypothetical protein
VDIVSKWLWIVLTVVVILLLVHPNSNAEHVIGSISNESLANIKALQGNAPTAEAAYGKQAYGGR